MRRAVLDPPMTAQMMVVAKHDEAQITFKFDNEEVDDDSGAHDGEHYWIRILCQEPGALGKEGLTLGKGFAESRSRQRTLGSTVDDDVFGES